MARFIGYLRGRRGRIVSRLGTRPSGIRVAAQGWNCGVEVFGLVDEEGKDVFMVYKTGGSNNPMDMALVLTVREPKPEPEPEPEVSPGPNAEVPRGII